MDAREALNKSDVHAGVIAEVDSLINEIKSAAEDGDYSISAYDIHHRTIKILEEKGYTVENSAGTYYIEWDTPKQTS